MKRRIFGLETEYGLTFLPNGKVYLPMEKVLGYIFEGLLPNNWPSNAFLVNGARFYQDTGCHPEYATPECDDLYDLIAHDKAGERLLETCMPIAEKRLQEEGLSGDIYVYKNNTDSLGNTYGCHENYLMQRDVDFWKISEYLIPFFVTRQIYTGAGKVLKSGGKTSYFISQRSQHIHEKTSSSTTSSRSIINTRDEPHSDAEKYRRLHIIIGDSNMSEYSTYLKTGTTVLLLAMLEDGIEIKDMELDDPVKALRDISKDTSLKSKVKLLNGKEFSALEIQRVYLEEAVKYVGSIPPDPVYKDILDKWIDVIEKLEQDIDSLSTKIDWIMKQQLIRRYMRKKKCSFDDSFISMIDLQYHDINRKRGLYYLLEREGLAERIVREDKVETALEVPPQTTRAKIRGDFIRFAKDKNKSYTVDWSYIKLNGCLEETILCIDPFNSYDERVAELISMTHG